jgi:hypothetical protein
MWDLWSKKWHRDKIFSALFSYYLSISFYRGSPCSYIIWGTNNRPFGGRRSQTKSHPHRHAQHTLPSSSRYPSTMILDIKLLPVLGELSQKYVKTTGIYRSLQFFFWHISIFALGLNYFYSGSSQVQVRELIFIPKLRTAGCQVSKADPVVPTRKERCV